MVGRVGLTLVHRIVADDSVEEQDKLDAFVICEATVSAQGIAIVRLLLKRRNAYAL